MALFCVHGALAGRLNLARTIARTSSTWLLQHAQGELDCFMVTLGSKSECCKREDVELPVSSGLGSQTGTAKLSPNSHGPRSHRAQPGSRERRFSPLDRRIIKHFGPSLIFHQVKSAKCYQKIRSQ